MTRQLIFILLVLATGVAVGFFASSNIHQEAGVMPVDSEDIMDYSSQEESIVFSSTNDDLKILHQRISELEQSISDIKLKLENVDQDKEQVNLSTNEFPKINKPLTKARLVDAGIDEQLAENIIREKDEREFQKLDLKDRAIRENFINTPRYIQELRRLNTQENILREELGDDTYDRYLYASGTHNRVSVASVMQGSPADHAGFETGDMILSYADQKVFQWSEINKATTQGLRGEAVIVNVLRNGELLNISVPRGPLGVKLIPAFGEPLGDSFY